VSASSHWDRPASSAGLAGVFAGVRRVGAVVFSRRRRVLSRLGPAQLFAATFLGLVLLGTLGFKALPGLYAEGKEPLSWLDALFTATSAVCVTGLIVVDTGTHFTRLGQAYVLLLVQLGGLGMLGLASFVILTFRSRLSLRQDAIATGGSAMPASGNVRTRSLVRDVLVFALLAELAGFALLFALWANDFPAREAAWHALFHSVSAFCNAGFSSFTDSLVGFQDRPATLAVIAAGVVVGGLGFLTLEELKLWLRARRKRRQFRLSLHARVVLTATLVLVLAGAAVIGPLEWGNPRTLGHLNVLDRLGNALFMSITPRTAGFHTVSYDQTLQATNFATILLMSIGGAPGSTAGGIKVTTVAVLVAMAYSRFKARSTTDFFHRTVPPVTSQRAVGLFAFSFSIIAGGVFLLAVVELDPGPVDATAASALGGDPYSPDALDEVARRGIAEVGRGDFLDVMFEATSAFNTVGLSAGDTSELSTGGRLLTIALMFIGRVGPLTIAAALSHGAAPTRTFRRFAHEDVVVG